MIDHGLDGCNATFLAGGAAGDFSPLSFEERCAVAEAVVEAAFGRVRAFVGLKWACPRANVIEFEDDVATCAGRLTTIDKHLMFAISAMLCVKAFQVYPANYWPEWRETLIDRLKYRDWQGLRRMLVDKAINFYTLLVAIEKTFTSSDGYLDQLCMELVGLSSSGCRPLSRDIRTIYHERCREMLNRSGGPHVLPAGSGAP